MPFVSSLASASSVSSCGSLASALQIIGKQIFANIADIENKKEDENDEEEEDDEYECPHNT